jgi:hypothetical protein
MLWVVAVLRKILDKFLAPSRWLHFPLNIIATVVALLYSESILVRNQTDEVYPPEGDSIGIPLMGMAFYSVLSLVLLLVGMGLVRRGTFARWSGHLLIFLLALGYLVQIADWGDPLHYEIGLAQGSLGLLLCGYMYLEFRRRRLMGV